MKKLTYIIYLIIFIPLVVSGCSKLGIKQNSPDKALSYLKDKGYSIVSDEGKTWEYVLKKEDLFKSSYQQCWGVQTADAKDYLNKKIETYKFIVKNHPLDNYKENKNKQSKVWVMMCDNKVIGGYSLPDLDLTGGVYSIEGGTLQEVTGLSYQDWSKQWMEKYK